MATCCDLAGTEYPQAYQGRQILPAMGRSLLPVIQGKSRDPHPILCWEHIGSVGIRKENWKLVAARDEPWELYDLSNDRTELNNIIGQYMDKARELHADWLQWASTCGVKITEIHQHLNE